MKKGRLAWVRVDHVRVEGLIPNKQPDDPDVPVLAGEFGVFANAGACRLPKARLLIHKRED